MENAFLRALADHPDDNTARLVYADWLEERGDPRADFLRAECTLADSANDGERRLLLLPDLHRLGRDCDPTWMRLVSRTPIPPITCRLVLEPRPGAAYPGAVVELANEGPEPVTLEYSADNLFAYLDLVHRNGRGERLPPRGWYGNAFHNRRPQLRTVVLPPGEVARRTVALLCNIQRAGPLPENFGLPSGEYTVQAVFSYADWLAVSEPVPFEFRPENAIARKE